VPFQDIKASFWLDSRDASDKRSNPMENLALHFGTQVNCRGGSCGRLAKVAVNPDNWRVTHLILEEGILLRRARAFPFALVKPDTGGDFYLELGMDELSDVPIYQEHEVERPAPASHEGGSSEVVQLDTSSHGMTVTPPIPMIREKVYRGVPSEVIVIGPGLPISSSEGRTGKLNHFVVEPVTGRITDLVIHHGGLFPERVTLPVSLAGHIDDAGIFLAASRDEVEAVQEVSTE
jgi:hypothetical protein